MSDSDVNDSKIKAAMIALEESYYTKKSLDFINSYKTNFSPLLSKIAETLNNNSEESKSIIATMRRMTDNQNSNLKELIVKLKEMEDIGGNEARPIGHNGDYSKYVEQCLRLIQLQHSKQQRHTLFVSVMREMKANNDLMKKLDTLKASTDWTEWKKMVGMLIPEDANVKILTTVIEPSTWLKLRNKFTAVSGKEITGTVVKRAKLTGRVYGGEFKKLVKLQKDLIRNEGDNNVEFNPEHIQLIEAETEQAVPVVTEAQGAVTGAVALGAGPVALGPVASGEELDAKGADQVLEPAEPVAGTGAEQVASPDTGPQGTETTVASPNTGPQGTETTGQRTETSPVGPEQVKLEEVNKGGSQRLTRKNTKTIGTARKTRTNR